MVVSKARIYGRVPASGAKPKWTKRLHGANVDLDTAIHECN